DFEEIRRSRLLTSAVDGEYMPIQVAALERKGKDMLEVTLDYAVDEDTVLVTNSNSSSTGTGRGATTSSTSDDTSRSLRTFTDFLPGDQFGILATNTKSVQDKFLHHCRVSSADILTQYFLKDYVWAPAKANASTSWHSSPLKRWHDNWRTFMRFNVNKSSYEDSPRVVTSYYSTVGHLIPSYKQEKDEKRPELMAQMNRSLEEESELISAEDLLQFADLTDATQKCQQDEPKDETDLLLRLAPQRERLFSFAGGNDGLSRPDLKGKPTLRLPFDENLA
ncbi:unnamed protein product, partial [Amoebophrya sp. A25]